MTSNCRACDTPLTRTFVDLKMSPLSNSYVPMANIDHAEKFYPLHTYVCEKCFLVQLAEFESPEHIFSVTMLTSHLFPPAGWNIPSAMRKK